MNAGPVDTVLESSAGVPQIAGSAVVVGAARLGEGSLARPGRGRPLPRRRRCRSRHRVGGARELRGVGNATIPTTIGRRSVFGHRCMVVGATVGDLCEIGNASVLMPGARLGDRVFLGEGTLVPAG